MEIYGKDLSKKWELVRFEIPNGVGLFVWRSGLEFTPWWSLCI